jgi:hypothetical protein
MAKYSKQELDKFLNLVLEEGLSVKDAFKAAGVSHTPAELHAFKFEWFVADLPEPGTGEWAFSDELVVYLRLVAQDPSGKIGWGYGRIMVALDATEGRVRKAMKNMGIEDKGHRTGKGGRFLGNDPRLYEADLKATGVQIPVGKRSEALFYADIQRLMRLEMAELKAVADERDVPVKKGMTKVKLVQALAEAAY